MFSRIHFSFWRTVMIRTCHIKDLPKDDREQLPALDRYVLEFADYWKDSSDESKETTDGQPLRFFRACCDQIVVRDRKLGKDDREKLDACAAIILVGDNVLYFDTDEKA